MFDRSPRPTQGGKQFGFVGKNYSDRSQDILNVIVLDLHQLFASLYFVFVFIQNIPNKFTGSLPDTLTIHYAVQTKDRKRMKLKQVKQTLMRNPKLTIKRYNFLLMIITRR